MAELNFQALDVNFISALDDQEEMATSVNLLLIHHGMQNITFVLLNLQAPPGLTITKARFLKMKSLDIVL